MRFREKRVLQECSLCVKFLVWQMELVWENPSVYCHFFLHGQMVIKKPSSNQLCLVEDKM